MKKPFVRWGQLLGPLDRPFMKRWAIYFGPFSIRLHHWLDSDTDRNLHDHPWWFITLILRGQYTEHLNGGASKVMKQGEFGFRRATHRHRVTISKQSVLALEPCWSVVVTGPIKRKWGFWDKNNKFTEAPDQDYMT